MEITIELDDARDGNIEAALDDLIAVINLFAGRLFLNHHVTRPLEDYADGGTT